MDTVGNKARHGIDFSLDLNHPVTDHYNIFLSVLTLQSKTTLNLIDSKEQ